MERVNERTIAAAQLFALAVREREHQVVVVTVQIAKTGEHRRAINISTATLSHVERALHRNTLKVLAQNEIDHTPDCVGSVNGGGTVFEHFNTINRGHRDLI